MKKIFIACAIVIAGLILIASGCASGSNDEPALLTIGDREIGRIEANYFIFSSAHMMRSLLPHIGWNDYIDDIAVSDYIKTEALNAMRLYYAIHVKAAELSAGLTSEQQQELEDVWNERVSHYGSEEAFRAYLESEGITAELFMYVVESFLLRSNLYELHPGVDFEALTESWRDEVPYRLGAEWEKIDVQELYENYRA